MSKPGKTYWTGARSHLRDGKRFTCECAARADDSFPVSGLAAFLIRFDFIIPDVQVRHLVRNGVTKYVAIPSVDFAVTHPEMSRLFMIVPWRRLANSVFQNAAREDHVWPYGILSQKGPSLSCQ